MTESEKHVIIDAVLSALRTNSRTIGQLTPVSSLSPSDQIEISGGRRVSYATLAELISSLSDPEFAAIREAIDRMEILSVSVTAADDAATLSVKCKDKTISCPLPIVTASQSGILTAYDKRMIDATGDTAKSALEIAQKTRDALDALVGENASEAIDNFREVLSFLEGVSDDERLAGKLAELGSGVADAGAMAAEAGKRVGTVAIDGLDFSDDELAAFAFAMETKPGVYRVTAEFAGAPEVQTVGTLLMMTDSMGHCVTQLLISNYNVINEDGTLNTQAHDHRKVTVLERRWSSTITDVRFDGWGAWREAWNSQTAETMRSDIDEAKGAADDASAAVVKLAAEKGMPDGLAPLDAGRRVPVANLPPRATVSFFHGFAEIEAPEAVTVGEPEGIFYSPGLGAFVAAYEGQFCNNWAGADEYGTPTANGRVPASGKLYCDATDGVLYHLDGDALTALATGGDESLSRRITELQNTIDRVSGDLTKLKISKGWPDGIAPLDSDRHVPMMHLPARASVSPFAGAAEILSVIEASITVPETIVLNNVSNTFVALAEGKYYNNWAGSYEYGSQTSEGIVPVKWKLYLDTEEGGLCFWSGERMVMATDNAVLAERVGSLEDRLEGLAPGDGASGMTAEEGRELAEKIFN